MARYAEAQDRVKTILEHLEDEHADGGVYEYERCTPARIEHNPLYAALRETLTAFLQENN